MARATTKEQLKQGSEENFRKLFDLIRSMTEEEQEQPFAFEDRDKTIRDVLVYLYEWHRLLLNWIETNQSGKNASFLPDPYNWRTYPRMNVAFWEKHQKTPYKEAIALLEKSHSDVMKLIDTFTDDQLFTKKRYSWTGNTNLGSYCISSTASHYDWAIKKIKHHKKSLRH